MPQNSILKIRKQSVYKPPIDYSKLQHISNNESDYATLNKEKEEKTINSS